MKLRTAYILFGVVCLAGTFVYGYPEMDEDEMDNDDMEGEDMMGEHAEDLMNQFGGMEDMMGGMAGEKENAPEHEEEDVPVVEKRTAPFVTPAAPVSSLFYDIFQTADKWDLSQNEKYKGTFKIGARSSPSLIGDLGMKVSSDSSHHRATAKMTTPMTSNKGKSLYAAYEVQFEDEVKCGGQYFKLFNSQDSDSASFGDSTPYSIMFGPDKCGMTNKVHFIVKYKDPKTGEWHEAHLSKPSTTRSGSEAHSYGFAIHADDTYEIYGDGEVLVKGNMKGDFTPGFGNEKMILDPNDKKPADWVEDKKMPDPAAVKPNDWNEDAPKFIRDENANMPDGWLVDEPHLVQSQTASKPEDWDDVEDGEWKPPMVKNPKCNVGCGVWTPPEIPNPDYQGPWEAPMIDNPNYKGPWKAQEIENPNHFSLDHPHDVAPFDSVGFEIWTVQAGAIIDNMIITHDKESFDKFVKDTLGAKSEIEKINAQAAQQKAKADQKKKDTERKLGDASGSDVWSKNPILIGLGAVIPVIGIVFFTLRKRTATPDVGAAKKDDDASATEKTSEKTDDKTEDKKEKTDEKADDKPKRKESSEAEQADTAAGVRRRKASDKTIDAK